jgi:hypothetical protein
VLLSLTLAGQVVAVTWSPPIPLTSSGGGFAEDVVAPGGSTAVAAYVEWNGSWYDVKVRRSTNSGSSWAPPQTLSTNGFDVAIAGRGSFIDVVWFDDGPDRIKYARSTDAGLSYGPPANLTPAGIWVKNLSVARNAEGLVVVAWQNGKTDTVWARVSIDGGVSFGAATRLSDSVDLGTAAAVGKGVVYVVYARNFDVLRVRRSTDGGTTWSSPMALSGDIFAITDTFAITAVGSSAYVAYTDENPNADGWGTVRYRRTTNKGASWSAERNLAPPKWRTWEPDIDLKGGVVRAVFTRLGSEFGAYYRSSSDGLTWSATEKVMDDGYEASVVRANKIIVLFRIGTGDAFVKTGT